MTFGSPRAPCRTRALEAGYLLGLRQNPSLRRPVTPWRGSQAHLENGDGGNKRDEPQDPPRLATISGAESIVLSKDLTSLEVERLDDLVVRHRNPLPNIEHTTSIRDVMTNGRLREAARLDEVWAWRQPLPAHWLWPLEAPVTTVLQR